MNRPPNNQDRDLGFGSVADLQRSRLVARDGSIAVRRFGHDWRARLDVYHAMLTMGWDRFLLLAAAVFLVFNALFALAYLGCGEGAISGPASGGPFARAFFLAVQTSSTVGYGQLAPSHTSAQLVMTLQAFLSLVLVALGTGVVFARFSRPSVDLAWSDRALVSPYGDGLGLMLRIANRRQNQVFDLHAKLMLVLDTPGRGTSAVERRFHPLSLERERVSFFPLSWTIVHPIDEDSPLAGLDAEAFMARRGELIVLLRGRDATTSQDVHAWSSYTADEVEFGARFVAIFERGHTDGPIRMDVDRVHEFERVSS